MLIEAFDWIARIGRRHLRSNGGGSAVGATAEATTETQERFLCLFVPVTTTQVSVGPDYD